MNGAPSPVDEAMLHAFVDDELSADDRDRVAAWLAEHPDAAANVVAWRQQGALLHAAFDPVLDEPVPERLRRLAEAPRSARVPWLRIAAGVALFAAGLGVGWLAQSERAVRPPEVDIASHLVRDAFGAHQVFSPEVRHPVEVAASEEAHLVGWLTKRIGAPVRAPQLAQSGFRLMGGRLLAESGQAAAQFMYEDPSGARLTLYVRRMAADQASAFRFAESDGMAGFYWMDGTLGYALIGAIGRDRLLPITRAVYDQLDRPRS
jgi:anti-sigma factor RsiW